MRQQQRRLKDLFSSVRFARRESLREGDSFGEVMALSQPFKPSETLEGKKHNLRQAAERINRVSVAPGEVFSFWRIVGSPHNPRRFAEGRSIHCGKPVKDRGGGLCQASGIIYHAALMLGLEVSERHSHSVDLYTDETRFAPIGTDATVFYGYKDLRLRNNTGAALNFCLEIGDKELRLSVRSAGAPEIKPLSIDCIVLADGRKKVTISRKGCEDVVTHYLPLED